MQVKRNGRKKKGIPGAVKGLLVVVLLGVASLGVAYLWQSRQEMAIEPVEQNTQEPQPVKNSTLDAGRSQPEESGLPEPETTEETELPGAEPDEDEGETQGRAAVEGAVPQSGRVGNSYFEDAIFFGDSLSTGIPLYQVAGNPDTVAFTGINPDSINYTAVIPTAQGNQTVLEAAQQYGGKKKVYIMLGANGLWMDDDSFVNGYQTFIDSVKTQYPEATIYLQSILPVTRTAYLTYETADNAVIDHFNELVRGLAQKNQVNYLDIAQVMKDEEGYLPDEASPYDGMHLTPEYYNKWFEYLKTHTVEEKQ